MQYRDLLKRHRSCHDAENEGGRSSKRAYNSASRVSQACRLCAAAKIKCDDQKPCSRCSQRGVTCEYATDLHEADKSTTSNASNVSNTSLPRQSPYHGADETALASMRQPDDPNEVMPASDEGDMSIGIAGQETTTQIQQTNIHPHLQPQPLSHTPNNANQDTQMAAPPILDPLAQDMSGFLREVMMPTYPHPNFMPMDHTAPSGLLDFRVDADFALNDTDYGFLDQLCGDLFTSDGMQPPYTEPPPFESPLRPSSSTIVAQASASETMAAAMQQGHPQQASAQHNSHPLQQRPKDASGPGATTRQNIALGVEAFRRSALGIWLPAQQDRTDAQMEHLSILTDEAGSPDTRINIDRRCLREALNRTMRDELLAMIMRTCGTERMSFVVRSFPTAELLGDLIECFFIHHQQQTDSYIHAPSFRPNGQRPELLGAIVASGATTADIRSIRKLGYAMQEAVRTTLVGTCEDANSTTREIWLLQAFLCELQIGLWSGIKRKMEISESHTQVVLTMLRRAGRFQHAQRTAPGPQPEDTGEGLRQKWLAWCKQESFRRMAFHAFVCDAQVSISMQTTPILSYAEMSLPFPASRDLWTAETPEQWKMLYLNRAAPDSAHMSLIDFLQHPTELPDHYDVPLASLVVLFGLWGMIAHHLQLVRVMSHRSSSYSYAQGLGSGGYMQQPSGQHQNQHQQHGAASTLRHQELLQMLQHVRMSMAESPQQLGPETSLVLELLHVNLHCNFADLQLFAGRGDVEDARRVLPDLQQWVASREARLTVWHAGQVLRAAATFPVKQLHNFYTVAVYHAGLTLWAYGVISQAKTTPTGPTGPSSQPGWGEYPLAAQARSARNQSISSTSTSYSASLPQMLCVDGAESQAVQRFVTLGKGIPCIGQCRRAGMGEASAWNDSDSTLVPLSDPEAVMDTVVELLEKNFATKGALDMEESLSPLVENLVQLMKGLGRAARNVSN